MAVSTFIIGYIYCVYSFNAFVGYTYCLYLLVIHVGYTTQEISRLREDQIEY